MALGLGTLGLTARDFWNLTPREFEAIVRGRLGFEARAPALSRFELERLMKQFPDHGDTL